MFESRIESKRQENCLGSEGLKKIQKRTNGVFVKTISY